MNIDYRVSIDFDRDSFVNRTAAPGDPLNLVTTPLTFTDWAITAAGTGGSDTQASLDTDWGTRFTQWTSGTSGTGSLTMGATSDPIAPCANLTAHTLIFWIKSTSASYDAVGLEVEVRNSTTGSVITTSSGFTVTSAEGWKKIAVQFTMPASGAGVYMRVQKTGSTTNAVYWVTGHMVVVGTYTSATAPGFNIGTTLSTYDNITEFVKSARWNVGARGAYADVADTGTLSVEVENEDRRFSPEYTSSPYASSTIVECSIFVDAMEGSDLDWTRMWRGWIDTIAPLPGQHGDRIAVLDATDSRRFLDGKEIKMALQTNVRFSDVLIAILATAQAPSVVGSPLSGAQGRYQWAYAGDNWEQGTTALDAITEIAAAERAFVYYDRVGQIVYWLRTTRYDLYNVFSSLAATFDNVQEAMDYRYGDSIHNVIEVTRYPRRLSTSTTALLWTLNENLVLAPLEVKTIFARYHEGGANDSGIHAVGAVPGSIASGTFTSSGGTVNHVETPYAQGCDIEYTNPSASVTRTVTAHTLTGQRILAKDGITARYEDATSKSNYGSIGLALDLALVSARADQDEIGAIELARHKDPFGRVHSITIAPRDSTREGWMVDLTIGSKIRVQEYQTDHDAYYIICGEEHEATDGLSWARTTYYLEPAVDNLI